MTPLRLGTRRQRAGAVAGPHRAVTPRGARPRGRISSSSRQPATGCRTHRSASRRQASLRQGSRGRTASRRDRSGRAQREGSPVGLPAGLMLAATLPREDPRDAHRAAEAVRRTGNSWRFSAVVPTRSAPDRRHRQRPPRRPVISTDRRAPSSHLFAATSIRVSASWIAGQFDALVLACAGLRRLSLEARISAAIPVDRCVPAPGQGIVVMETRADDRRVLDG